MDDSDKHLADALRETLLHIAGVSGTAARRLRQEQALVADLGLEDIDLEVLAGCQCRLGDHLRLDREITRINADELYDLAVRDVFTLTIWRALGRKLSVAKVAFLFARAQEGLRGYGGTGADHGKPSRGNPSKDY